MQQHLSIVYRKDKKAYEGMTWGEIMKATGGREQGIIITLKTSRQFSRKLRKDG